MERILVRYSKNDKKEWAYYNTGDIAHKHKLNPNSPDNLLGCKQAYSLVVNGQCYECGKKPPQ